MKILILILFVLSSCEYSEDPISKNFRLADNVILINEQLDANPSYVDSVNDLHRILYENLGKHAKLKSVDNSKWTLEIKKSYFNLSSNDLVELEDFVFSINEQSSYISKNYPDFEIVSHNNETNEIKLIKSFDLNLIFNDSNLFLFSKQYAVGDIPVGTGDYFIFMRPTKNEYLLMPFVKFIHTNNSNFKHIFWTNMNLVKLKEKEYNFNLSDLNKYKTISLGDLHEYR